MQHRQTPFGYMLVLEKGDELIDSLESFATVNEVGAASLHGLGAVHGAVLGAFVLDRDEYVRRTWDEELEVCSLDGTISLIDSAPFAHVHGVFGRPDSSTIGGHVFEATCSVTLEIAVYTAPEPIHRTSVDYCKLDLIRFET